MFFIRFLYGRKKNRVRILIERQSLSAEKRGKFHIWKISKVFSLCSQPLITIWKGTEVILLYHQVQTLMSNSMAWSKIVSIFLFRSSCVLKFYAVVARLKAPFIVQRNAKFHIHIRYLKAEVRFAESDEEKKLCLRVKHQHNPQAITIFDICIWKVEQMVCWFCLRVNCFFASSSFWLVHFLVAEEKLG